MSSRNKVWEVFYFFYYSTGTQNDIMISIRFQGKPLNITVIKSMPQSLMSKMKLNDSIIPTRPPRINNKNNKNVLFIIGDWNANVESQEMPRVTGKFGLGI